MAEKRFCHALYADSTIILALFRDVENAKEVKQAVMNGQFDAALLKASMVSTSFDLVLKLSIFCIHGNFHFCRTT